jgi:flagellar hook-associated protein 1 FlgK
VQIGSGVEVAQIKRLADSFVDELLRSSSGQLSEANVQNDSMGQIEELFPLNGTTTTIGSALDDFFSSVNQLSASPANIDLRLNVMQKAEGLVSVIKSTFGAIAQMQKNINDRLPSEIDTVNTFTRQIASLNSAIQQRESGGQTALDARDQRDVLMQKLADKISFKTVESSNGTVSIFLDNGFPLVNGYTSRDLSTTTNPSFAGATLPPSLSGDVLNYIVYDYGGSGNPSHLDLTQAIKGGSGQLGGLLKLRGYAAVSNTSPFEADGALVAVATRIEALTRSLLVDVNKVYLGGTPGNAGDLDGNSPGPFGLFDFAASGVKDDGDGIPEYSDLTNPALGVANFSSILKLGISDPRKFAAAQDADPDPNVSTFPSGDGRNAQALARLRTTPVNVALGSFSFTGTYDEMYNSTVTFVGNAKATADVASRVAQQGYTTAANRRDSVSAVNLDEEFANLIKYQKAFQASARMVKTASDLLDQIVSLI